MPLHGDYAPSSSARTRSQVEEYERTGGASPTNRGKPIVVLTSVGATSGKLRKTALMRVEHDGRYAVVASLGGAPQHPQWYHNLVADPHVELQDGPDKRDYLAREVSGDEKREWWVRAAEAWPDYDAYQARTSRDIPVFVLEPIEASESAGTDQEQAS
jgi:deazaflavin-dependent oxidoreductase (nitroreductase family)